MKVFNVVMKVLVALAAVAGAAYVIVTYGDKIVAWVKKVWGSVADHKCCCGDDDFVAEEDLAEEVEVPAEEPAEAPAEEAPAEEDPAVVTADDGDFEG